MADEYVYTILSRCLQKWSYDIKHVEIQPDTTKYNHFPWFPDLYFLTDF